MPHSDTHREKRSKNYFWLVALLLLAATLFYLSMLKVSGQ